MSTPAYCVVAQSPMRAEPSDKSEMVSQMLFGESAEILDQKDSWCFIQTSHDGYQGWMDRKHLVSSDLVLDLSPLTSPSIWKDNFSANHRLSPGSFVSRDKTPLDLAPYSFEPIEAAPGPKELVTFAEQYLGTPYLWGGRSLYGIDCSGYTQMIARFAGLSIPRDAYQQAEVGEHITFLEETRTGDFAFFDNSDGRIIHVGMIVRYDASIRILHASGNVRNDLLDHQGIFRTTDQIYTHNLRLIKRIV
jgi:gamma-D-glutamyl-L-lysine dipeptidyl-peptidase